MGRAFAVCSLFQTGKIMKQKLARLLALSAVLLASQAHAAIDITAATTGITDASVAVLAVLAGMIVMAAAVFGVRKVLALIRG